MLLDVRTLTKRFGGLTAVADVSFGIERGEIVGVFGPNGSGKTTLLSLISGFHVPTSGCITFKERSLVGLAPHQIANLGVVKTFQNPQLFAELTVYDHLNIAGHLMVKRQLGWGRVMTLVNRHYGQADAMPKRAAEVLDICRLSTARDALAADLSYGQEKMLGVAMALMCGPELLLLDEPASGLGHGEITELHRVLVDLRDTGMTLCVIDHQVKFLSTLAGRAIALHHGAKIAEGPPDAVLKNPDVVAAYLGKSHAEGRAA